MTYYIDREVRSRGDIRAGDNIYVYDETSTAYKVPVQQQTNPGLIQSGTVSIASGADTGTLTFAVAFSAAPVVVTQEQGTEAGNLTQVAVSSVSAAAFNISANASTTADYTRGYIAFGDR